LRAILNYIGSNIWGVWCFMKKNEHNTILSENIEEQNLDDSTLKVKRRKLEGTLKHAVTVIATLMCLYHLYSAIYKIDPIQQRAIHLMFVLVLIYMLYPANHKSPKHRPSSVDWILVVLSIVSVGNVLLRVDAWARTAMRYNSTDVLFGVLTVLLVIEAARRAMGMALPIISCMVILYGFYGHLLPGLLSHSQFSFKRIINTLSMTTNGIYGSILGVSSTYIYLFILFGAILGVTGLSKVFNDLAMALAGGLRGGPAKVAVLASGLMGSISGSTSANVVTTGTFTIPLMKRTGFSDYYAAAVEAAASTGGQIMPPIMGAASFLIADALGIPYIQVIKAALLPAILYFFSVWTMVDLRARRVGLIRIPRDELPNAKEVLLRGGHLMIPLIGIIYVLISGKSAIFAALVGIVLSVISSFLKRDTWIKPRDLIKGMEAGALSALSVASACAIIGTVVGILTMSGVILTIGDAILKFGRGSMAFSLGLTMMVCIIMGMGLPTTACYILTSTIAAPVVTTLGASPLQAHMFVFYFGILASITPPVATGAYTAAGLAGSDPNRTGWMALRIALAGFVVPYMFIYSPELLLLGNISIQVILRVVATSLIGIKALGWAVEGFYSRRLPWMERLVSIVAAICLIHSGLITDIIGVGLALIVFATNFSYSKKTLSSLY
jgi:TRAP transporter 4TM/12TM fusion protein